MYAQQADVEARMDRPLLDGEQARVAALLEDVAAALSARYGADLTTLVSDHLGLLVSAQARAVARIIATPVGPVQNTHLDDATVGYFRGYADLLIAAETNDLDTALGRGTGGGLLSLQLTSSSSPPPEA